MFITHITFVRKLNAPNNPIVNALIASITAQAYQHKIVIVDESELPKMALNADTLIISVGGDGTMLHAMRLSAIYGIPCVGFHAGRLGFLNDYSAIADVDKSINTLFETMCSGRTEFRTSMQVVALNGSSMLPKPIPLSFNEVALSRTYSDQILEYDMEINQQSVGTHRANSILLSSPTGSTAYALSAGGAIIMPDAELFQIVPVAPNTLASRPLIIPMYPNGVATRLTIKPVSSDVSLRVDGIKIDIADQITCVTVQAGPRAQILHNPEWSFFNTLSTKLGWLKDET